MQDAGWLPWRWRLVNFRFVGVLSGNIKGTAPGQLVGTPEAEVDGTPESLH